MSLIIKGVDMPKIGESMTYSFKEIIEIPRPHGRLIDADALEEEADSQPCFWKGAIDELMVREAPTIIEAEE